MAVQKTRFLGERRKITTTWIKRAFFDLDWRTREVRLQMSHAAAYCSGRPDRAWLKNYYTVEFYAAFAQRQ